MKGYSKVPIKVRDGPKFAHGALQCGYVETYSNSGKKKVTD